METIRSISEEQSEFLLEKEMRKWLGVLLLGAIIYLASTKFRLSNILYVSSCHLA